MVLVVFVIMLLNVEAEEHRRPRLTYLLPVAVVLAAVLIGEVAFVLYSVPVSLERPPGPSDVGLTESIGPDYLLSTFCLLRLRRSCC